jgi:hypothetical protein
LDAPAKQPPQAVERKTVKKRIAAQENDAWQAGNRMIGTDGNGIIAANTR